MMLIGADLLAPARQGCPIQVVKELGDVSKSDLVRGCGYICTNKDGTERLNFTAFQKFAEKPCREATSIPSWHRGP